MDNSVVAHSYQANKSILAHYGYSSQYQATVYFKLYHKNVPLERYNSLMIGYQSPHFVCSPI